MWPVFVLLWNHCLMRKHRWIRSCIDFVSPVMYFLLIEVLSNVSIELDKPNNRTYTEPFALSQPGLRDQVRVLYAPETRLTNQLMDKVGAKFNLSRLDHLPGRNEKGYFPFSNVQSSSLLKYLNSMDSNDAIVIFEDMESDTWPMRLNYTIRMKNRLMTHKYYYPLVLLLDSTNWFSRGYIGTQYAPFLRLQWAIDTSYLSLRTGEDVAQTLMLQELPDDKIKMSKVETGCIMAFFFLPISVAMIFMYLTDTLFEGKNSGIHELIKMVGVSWEALCVSHVLDVVPNWLMYAVGGTIFFKVSGIVPNTSGGFIAVAMTLHFTAVVALAFLIVYVFNMTDHLSLLASGLYCLVWLVSMINMQYMNPIIFWPSCCFLPHFPYAKFWNALLMKESRGKGVTMSNMWDYDSRALTLLSPGHTFVFMMLQTILFFLLAGYLARVRPGKYGQALPWNFPCRKGFWSKKTIPDTAPEEAQSVHEPDPRYFEKAPADLPVGIQIINVHKSFGKEAVLHGVNLTVYRGEITVLLGHNGAGKTTLISIITGLISATSGHVLVEGKDTVKQAVEVRKTIGLCPQHNIFFPHLTVLQHVMFFGMLKGQTYAESKASAKALLVRLQLTDKANTRTEELSGGMKRRAQFACAVAGGASVLMLDEPTSGLDVETRRELWNLLLSLRGERTLLLTTHFMEEADALGDRIAALHHGVLRCHATGMFLKRAIGTGYRLSCTTIGAPKESAITAVITSIVPDAALRDQKPNGVTYSLPAKDTAKFPQLFTALEERRVELGIDIIGVGKSTLDEVFMELCSDEKPTLIEESDSAIVVMVHEKKTGAKLYARQFAMLLLRQWYYVTSRLLSLLFITPFLVLLLWLITLMSNYGTGDSNAPKTAQAMNLDLYAIRPQRRALVSVDDAYVLAVLRDSNPAVHFYQVPDVTHAALRTGREDVKEYKKYLVGIELNNTRAKALYTTRVRHAAPVAVNLLSNALAARLLVGGGLTITTRNHPLPGAYMSYDEEEVKEPKNWDLIKIWTKQIAFLTFMYMCKFAGLPCAERASGTRMAHVLAGCPRALLWAATLAAQLAQALLLCALPVVACAAAADKDRTFNRPGFLMALCNLLLLGFLAFLGLAYFVSTIVRRTSATTCLFIIVFICTMITPAIPANAAVVFLKLASMLEMVVPPHTFAQGLQNAARVAYANAFCELNRDRCPELFAPDPFDDTICCESPGNPEPWSYWSMGEEAAGSCMLTLAIQAVIYFLLMYLSDSGVFSWLLVRMRPRPAPPPPRSDDPAARDEAAYVSDAIKLPKKQITDAVLCHNLQKSYPVCCNKRVFFAVKKISFSVKKGECFGLLGVNGAGKSTTFKMLTGETWLTGGDVIADGQELRLCNRNKYMRTFSYCPQFFGVDDFMTGRQNLVLLLTLRGLHSADVKAISDSWIKEVGLEQHADKRVSSYSGGCARRLAAAAALCQRARTVLLDEPTAGVDPVARRRMHQALLRARNTSALIIASHSMDEIEALCHRIAIMSGGELRALGSASALKAQYGAGYSIVFKLNYAQDVPEGAPTLDDFKSELQRRFSCTLLDEHLTMLSYHIKDKLRYSELFASVERLKQQFPGLVEDYTVTETTLEEVFLAFAKEAHAPSV